MRAISVRTKPHFCGEDVNLVAAERFKITAKIKFICAQICYIGNNNLWLSFFFPLPFFTMEYTIELGRVVDPETQKLDEKGRALACEIADLASHVFNLPLNTALTRIEYQGETAAYILVAPQCTNHDEWLAKVRKLVWLMQPYLPDAV